VLLIGVLHVADEFAWRRDGTESVFEFAHQRLGVSLVSFHPSAGKFPEAWKYGFCSSLSDQVSPVPLNDSGDDTNGLAGLVGHKGRGIP
ncbi:MAG: hypothetical protein ACI9KE_006495, partial [Polyangiales bacterium]